jgi:hypothetical protein
MTGTEDPLRLAKVLAAFFNSAASNTVDVE